MKTNKTQRQNMRVHIVIRSMTLASGILAVAVLTFSIAGKSSLMGTASDTQLHTSAPVTSLLIPSGKTQTTTSEPDTAEKLLSEASERRDALLEKSVTVTAMDPERSDVPAAVWTVDLRKHPELLISGESWLSHNETIDQAQLATLIASNAFENQNGVVDVHVDRQEKDGKVMRAAGVPIARDGFAYYARSLALQIVQTFDLGLSSIVIAAPHVTSSVSMQSDAGPVDLTLL